MNSIKKIQILSISTFFVGCMQIQATGIATCINPDDVTFPGMPTRPEGFEDFEGLEGFEAFQTEDGEVATSVSFTHDASELLGELAKGGLEASLRLDSASLVAADSMENFMFLSSVQVRLGTEEEDPQLPGIELLNCQPGNCAFEQSRLTRDANPNPSLDGYLKGPMVFTVEVVGELPEEEWGVGMELCLQADVNFGIGYRPLKD